MPLVMPSAGIGVKEGHPTRVARFPEKFIAGK
jgi:hypothetical protein